VATVITCSLCDRQLMAHCDGVCDWYACTNHACSARFYDVRRGILLHVGGSVERLGTTG
jgi:hypothetical protein